MQEKDARSETAFTRNPAIKVAIVATYAGTCVGAAYMLTLIPNIEIYSMLVFLGGLLFGKMIGALNGFLSSLIYFVFNILGASPAPLLLVQLITYTMLGFTGGIFKETRIRRMITRQSQIVFGILGAGFMIAYTFFADFVFSIVMGVNFFAWFLQGLVFTILLIACNIITFSMLLPLLIVGIDKHLPGFFPPAMEKEMVSPHS
jgi:hypothetical protein